MKIYTVQRQDMFISGSTTDTTLLNLGCYVDRAKAIERSKEEYESIKEDGVLDPDYIELNDMYGYYAVEKR